MHRPPGAIRPTPAFLVVGTPRSGTTLVQRLCCELPGVRIPPETHFFSLFARSLVRRRRFPLDEAALRAELAAFLALKTSRGLALDVDAVVAALRGRCASPLALFAAIVVALAGPAELHGEKTPNHLLWWRPLAAHLPAVRFVAVVRDPRAVVASYRAAWDARDHRVLAERWADDQREVRRARAALGACMLELRYEDVVADPGRARAALAEHLHVDGSGAPTVATAARLEWETWKAGADGEIRADRRDAWRAVLSQRQAREVLHICRGELRNHGYASPARRRPLVASARRRLRFRARRRAKLAYVRIAGRALG